MKNFKKILFFFFAMTLLTSACKKDKDNDDDDLDKPKPTSTTFPFFKQNATWTYNDYDSDSPGVVISVVYKILSVDNDGYATVSWTIGGFSGPAMQWYADNTKFSRLCSKTPNKMLVYSTANPAVGDLWTEFWVDGAHTISDSVRVVALNETVVVPAGTFTNCIKLIETTSDDAVYYKYYWLNKTVGIVKTEGTTNEDYPTILYEDLNTYKLD